MYVLICTLYTYLCILNKQKHIYFDLLVMTITIFHQYKQNWTNLFVGNSNEQRNKAKPFCNNHHITTLTTNVTHIYINKRPLRERKLYSWITCEFDLKFKWHFNIHVHKSVKLNYTTRAGNGEGWQVDASSGTLGLRTKTPQHPR